MEPVFLNGIIQSIIIIYENLIIELENKKYLIIYNNSSTKYYLNINLDRYGPKNKISNIIFNKLITNYVPKSECFIEYDERLCKIVIICPNTWPSKIIELTVKCNEYDNPVCVNF